TNKAGTSGTSAPSAAIRAVGKPGMVGTPSATLVDTGGNGGKIDVRFPVLTAAQRNGSTSDEITYKYSLTSGGGSGNIPAGGGIVAAANGTQTAVVVWAVSSRSSTAGDASPASNSVNPYGLAFAPTVTGSNSSGVGDRTVSWTWNQPDGNGRAVTGYQYSLDGGAWQDTQERRFSKTVGYSETHTLRVRAISAGQPGRIGSDTSRSGAEPPPPVPTSWNITATPVRSCTEPRKGTDSYVAGNPSQCNGEGKWLDAGAAATTDRYQVWYKTSNNPTGIWYHLTSGMAAGNWIRCDTSNLGCNPPNGMPNR
ncbi:MAG: hypothetical protein C0488_14845, partial [Arthrobacter sp.]|nr:hypothetical protein [Arthrobacter sp.]